MPCVFMDIKAYPIIHARTYNIDFRTGKFLVCPKNFSLEDTKYFHRIVQDSTKFFELAPPEGRTVVCSNGKVIVVGKTIIFSELYEQCKETPKYVRVDNEDGRSAYGFIGVSFDLKSVKTPLMISNKSLLKIYEHYMELRWEETYDSPDYAKSTHSEPLDVEVETLSIDKYHIDVETKVVGDTATNRKEIIHYVFSRAIKGENVSLCTSLDPTLDTCFNYFTYRNSSTYKVNINGESYHIKESIETDKGQRALTMQEKVNHLDAPPQKSNNPSTHKVNINGESCPIEKSIKTDKRQRALTMQEKIHHLDAPLPKPDDPTIIDYLVKKKFLLGLAVLLIISTILLLIRFFVCQPESFNQYGRNSEDQLNVLIQEKNPDIIKIVLNNIQNDGNVFL